MIRLRDPGIPEPKLNKTGNFPDNGPEGRVCGTLAGRMASRFLIGEFELDPAARRLLRRGSGLVHLPNRPFQVLLYLVENRDRVVPRAELLERFWDGRDVYDDALTRCLSTVRKALDDQRNPACYVETRWSGGYRFIGHCREEPALAARVRPADRAHGAKHRARFADSRRTMSADRLVGRGNAYLNCSAHRSYRYALEMFRLAVQEDPEDARAHAGIAAAHALLRLHAEPCDTHRPAAEAALRIALELDPHCADVLYAHAQVDVMHDDYAGAHKAFTAAEALAPTQFRAWYYHGRGHAEQGDHEGALGRYLRAAQADPGDYQALALAEQSFRHIGLLNDARRMAIACVRAAEDRLLRRPDDVRALSLVACVLPSLGRSADAQGWSERAVALEPLEPFVNFNAACVYIALGDFDRALGFLRRVPLARGNHNWIAHDPCVDPVRSHPKFAAILPVPAAA
jgi:DNA-binding winged helix-turn-helix (wHTH) protein/tetratricopeptide (TPR) repeat protein